MKVTNNFSFYMKGFHEEVGLKPKTNRGNEKNKDMSKFEFH